MLVIVELNLWRGRRGTTGPGAYRLVQSGDGDVEWVSEAGGVGWEMTDRLVSFMGSVVDEGLAGEDNRGRGGAHHA